MDDYDKLQSELLNKYLWPNLIKIVMVLGLLSGAGIIFLASGAPDKPIDADMEVKVPGLVCPSCAIGIKRNLKREVNVKYLAFDITKELVLIDFIEIEGVIRYLKNDRVIKLVKDAGYEVTSIKRLDNKKPNRYNKP